jgi:hypothetical protein
MMISLQQELKDSKDDFQDNIIQQRKLLEVKKQLAEKLGMTIV